MLMLAAVKTCVVNFTGPDNVQHSTEVQAESVYEATAIARQFRENDWSAEPSRWTESVELTVKVPEVKHRVLLEQFYQFIEAQGGSLRQRSLRDRLKKILDEKP